MKHDYTMYHKTVYAVMHNGMLEGIFSSKEAAEHAIERYKQGPLGISPRKDNFLITTRTVDKVWHDPSRV